MCSTKLLSILKLSDFEALVCIACSSLKREREKEKEKRIKTQLNRNRMLFFNHFKCLNDTKTTSGNKVASLCNVSSPIKNCVKFDWSECVRGRFYFSDIEFIQPLICLLSSNTLVRFCLRI